MLRELNEADREIIRASIVEIAETIRKKYRLSIKEINRQLHLMVDIGV